MTDGDAYQTQPDLTAGVVAELGAAGFEDAEEIGRGGFGVVYRCVQPSLDRAVAVKVLTDQLDGENQARFLREQRAMGRLTGHPNIVGVLESGTTSSGRPYIVMNYHPHDSLDVWIRRRGPLTLDEALRLGVKMAGALETAHRLGVVHRDVKPANVLLTDYGEPALTDFGIAHVSGGFETATGTVTGSPAFTAPEVLKGNPASPASDIYGLGATLFCALTGHAAFERRSGEEVVAQFLRITTQPVPDLRGQGFPADVCAVIGRAMSGNPQDRPGSAAGLGNELREAELRHGFPADEMALHAESYARRSREYSSKSPTVTPQAGGEPLPAAGDDRVRRRSESDRELPVTVRASAGNLPLELTSFVGRRSELSAAKQQLAAARLVTLTGIGGVGKTRLALRVATEVQPSFADGAWLVELGELRDESLLPDVVAATLGLRDQSARPVPDALVEFLSPRQSLLVLDNCEQVVNGAARLVETLLRACPELRILITSREILDVGGEAVLRVPPLTVPGPDKEPSLPGLPRFDAMTLFVERAAAAVPTFTLTEDNWVAVAEISRRLDGLPLAIELAAARMRALSAEQIRQRLTDAYALLTHGSRGAPTRQQTLRLCMDWSFGLCSAIEQMVWSRLSVFAGGLELDAAEAVCGDGLSPPELLDALASLVDKSVLIREQPGSVVRFRLLEALRDYGREKLMVSGEYTTRRRRHREWYQNLALAAEAEWISPRQLEWIARLDKERANLREALDYCLEQPGEADRVLQFATALYPFWFARGLLTEGRRALERALERADGEPTNERVRALCAASLLAGRQGDLESGAALVREGNTLVEELDDQYATALIAYADGLQGVFGGDLLRAVERLSSVTEVFRTRGDLLLLIQSLELLGLVNCLLGDTHRAIAYCERAIAIAEPRGEVVYRSYSLWAMALAVWQQNDPIRAAGLLEQCLQLTGRVEDPLATAWCVEMLAWIAAGDNDGQRAAVLLGAAESLRQTVGNPLVAILNMRRYHEECEQLARRAIGKQAFAAARGKGKAFSFEAAVAYALRE